MASKTVLADTPLDGAFKSTASGFQGDPALLTVIRDEKHPLYDPRVKFAVDANHVALIKEGGVSGNIIVTKRDGQAVVIDGRQRTAACIEANKQLRAEGKDIALVTLTWVKGTDDFLRGLIWSSNTSTPNDTATWIHMFEIALRHGHTAAEFAAKNGKSPAWGKDLEACLSLEDSLLKRVQREEIPLTVAAALAKLPREEQVAEVARLTEAGTLTAAETRRAVREKKTGVVGPRYVKPRLLTATSVLVGRFAGGDLGRKRLPPGIDRDTVKHDADVMRWIAGETDTAFGSRLMMLAELAGRADGTEPTEEE